MHKKTLANQLVKHMALKNAELNNKKKPTTKITKTDKVLLKIIQLARRHYFMRRQDFTKISHIPTQIRAKS